KKKYLLNEDFAKINMKELVNTIGPKDLQEFKCETTASVWIENAGEGKFKTHQLPLPAQFAPINAITAEDMDGDGHIDLLLGGNEYQIEAGAGRYDASFGQFLRNNGKSGFTAIPAWQSGFIVEGELKGLQFITTANKKQLILAALNNDRLRCFTINRVKLK
ncbi:MAG: VCBS repeat-containing protein, partial [Ferruginibacter sp.]